MKGITSRCVKLIRLGICFPHRTQCWQSFMLTVTYPGWGSSFSQHLWKILRVHWWGEMVSLTPFRAIGYLLILFARWGNLCCRCRTLSVCVCCSCLLLPLVASCFFCLWRLQPCDLCAWHYAGYGCGWPQLKKAKAHITQASILPSNDCGVDQSNAQRTQQNAPKICRTYHMYTYHICVYIYQKSSKHPAFVLLR